MDIPEFYHSYGKVLLGADVYEDYLVYKYRGSTSLPMTLQAHIINEILKSEGIKEDFSFRPTPFKSDAGIPILPMTTITNSLFLLNMVT